MSDFSEFAFPSAYGHNSNGMSLRDYFASAALQGTIAALGSEFIEQEQPNFDVIALECYRSADAMLRARTA